MSKRDSTQSPFGGFFRRRDQRNPVSSPAVKVGFAAAGLFVLYLLGATGGYIWVHHILKNDQIGFTDVALFRWKYVRRGMADQQFTKAREEMAAKNFQAAYLAFSSGLRNDPDNIPGRLDAAKFLAEGGSIKMGVSVLETGLVRAPDNRELIERTFDLLVATGRDQRALDLLARRSIPDISNPVGMLLRTYEVQATLNLGKIEEAKQLLARYPEIEKNPASWPVVAQVKWETKERLRALDLLAKFVEQRPDHLNAYIQLAQWYLTVQMTSDAQATAERAVARFPEATAAQVLRVEAIGTRTMLGAEWVTAVETLLKDFGQRPEALSQLAGLAGRKGWVDLAWAAYQVGAGRGQNISLLAMFYSDALMRNSRFREARDVLTQVEGQTSEANAAFMVQLRQRQVMVASAMADPANIAEYTRRLVANLRNDPDQLESSRRFFEKRNIPEAMAVFSGSPAGARVADGK